MTRNTDQSSTAGEVQVFELTMDNPEDQEELNRRLRKTGENDPSASPKNRQSAANVPTGTGPARTDG